MADGCEKVVSGEKGVLRPRGKTSSREKTVGGGMVGGKASEPSVESEPGKRNSGKRGYSWAEFEAFQKEKKAAVLKNVEYKKDVVRVRKRRPTTGEEKS